MFGLGNAATPFGLKAMKSLQGLNKKKDTATRSMITFLVINTASVTIVPTTVISLRILNNSLSNPYAHRFKTIKNNGKQTLNYDVFSNNINKFDSQPKLVKEYDRLANSFKISKKKG